MASPNLDLVRAIYAGWERGDYASSAVYAHPDIEFVIADGPSPGRWRGGSAATDGYREVLNAWEDFRVTADEYRELDSERVLVLISWSGRGKRSGVEIDKVRAKGAGVYRVRDGKVTEIVHYWDRERALADLGLAA
jgi:ketosteroid isomerase-like protein